MNNSQWFFLILLCLSLVGGLFVALYSLFSGEDKAKKRLSAISKNEGSRYGKKKDFDKTARKRSVKEVLEDTQIRKSGLKKRVTMAMRIEQAGLSVSLYFFWIASLIFGTIIALLVFVFISSDFFFVLSAWFLSTFGLPNFFLRILRKRKLKKYLNKFPDVLDIIIRNVKSGIPIDQSFYIVSVDGPEVVRNSFVEIVEAKSFGFTTVEGIYRLYERIPLTELLFLAIVLQIQSESGGNLSDALQNLSNVLRERKILEGKVQSMSQEAKMSAYIIGFMPFGITALLFVMAPDYISTLFTDPTGHMLLTISGFWMFLGVVVMRKMINFKV
ncbi:MAG: type II secretion system F family protein [Alphaproteobacteria bacterium]|nr:type II secretion system F family protein [Alphaproteobacteria bacterium]